MKKILCAVVFLFLASPCYGSGNQYEMGYYATTGSTVTGNSAIITDASNNLLVSSKVGIGTNNPTKILHVRHTNDNGITTDRSVTSIYSGHTWLNNGAANERWFIGMIPNEDTFVFRNRGTSNGNIIAIEDQAQVNSFYIKANGNIGIGTSNPGSTLDMKGTLRLAGSTSGYVGLAPAAAAGSTTYTLPSADGSSGQVLSTNGSGALSWAAAGSSQWTTTGSDIYYSTGSVGIGTNAPLSALYVDAATGAGNFIRLHDGDPDYGAALGIGTNGDFVISRSHVGVMSESLRIQRSTGNIGIGTAAPTRNVVIAGEAEVLALKSTGNVGVAMSLDATVNSGHIYHIMSSTTAASQGAGYFLITDETASWADRLVISPAGNVGIGTSAPGYKLHVNGSVAGVGAYVNLSDSRSKKNVQPLGVGLKEITQLKPVSFEWKKSEDAGMSGQQIGFVAQDVEKIIPSLVLTGSDKEKTKSLKYSEIIPVLAKAVQELKVDNDKLRADFETYKKAHP